MKYIFLFLPLFLVFSFVSCTEALVKKPKAKKEALVEVRNGVYTEYYPGRKAIKFQGPQLKNGQRDGRWFFYAENGNKQSMTEFQNGKQHGFTFVHYPNGAIRYQGEYSEGKTIGVWKFYDENGHVASVINYDSINAVTPK